MPCSQALLSLRGELIIDGDTLVGVMEMHKGTYFFTWHQDAEGVTLRITTKAISHMDNSMGKQGRAMRKEHIVPAATYNAG